MEAEILFDISRVYKPFRDARQIVTIQGSNHEEEMLQNSSHRITES